ncbi:hypothetical protein BCR36DRAFT_366335 [Piromyces finnis]|uniref:PHD-type domain-containing protein n=1 Tax=Piromyces finnis TaxID=1754191 RepID=A0A1Y1VL12_9FUNG|nr:hypothetical protein BCR36DRAFT_366335 [Piromyces finnis]|eukprot:ORX59149.1 hypothetical protein BCR36DRAFT_366335 [Piromyces finnis]
MEIRKKKKDIYDFNPIVDSETENRLKLLPKPIFKYIPKSPISIISEEGEDNNSNVNSKNVNNNKDNSNKNDVDKNFIQFIEPSEEELANRIEYDMDEQDMVWLKKINKLRIKKGLGLIEPLFFEHVMDRLEKEWFELNKNLPSEKNDQQSSDDSVCEICNNGECENSNAIVFCDGCNIAVHQDCYGVPFIPEGQWLCRKCMISPEAQVSCVLCPNSGGAFKQTDFNCWAHLSCALWIPECSQANIVYMEPIINIEKIPRSRWSLLCYLCKKPMGACIQCSKKLCCTAFHVTCAKASGLYMELNKNGGMDNLECKVYCDRHTPEDYKHTHKVSESVKKYKLKCAKELSAIKKARRRDFLNGKYDKRNQFIAEELFNGKEDGYDITKAKGDFIVNLNAQDVSNETSSSTNNELTSSNQNNYLNTIPYESFFSGKWVIPKSIAEKIIHLLCEKDDKQEKRQFIIDVAKYWSMKRESRGGASLLKRLHIEPWSAFSTSYIENGKKKLKTLEVLATIRSNLEKMRTMTKMIEMRERRKLLITKIQKRIIEIIHFPISAMIRPIFNDIKRSDREEYFWFPVNKKEVEDYYDIIKHPMSFDIIENRINNHHYKTSDMDQIWSNAMLYNKEDTHYYITAVKLKNRINRIIKPIFEEEERLFSNQVIKALKVKLPSNFWHIEFCLSEPIGRFDVIDINVIDKIETKMDKSLGTENDNIKEILDNHSLAETWSKTNNSKSQEIFNDKDLISDINQINFINKSSSKDFTSSEQEIKNYSLDNEIKIKEASFVSSKEKKILSDEKVNVNINDSEEINIDNKMETPQIQKSLQSKELPTTPKLQGKPLDKNKEENTSKLQSILIDEKEDKEENTPKLQSILLDEIESYEMETTPKIKDAFLDEEENILITPKLQKITSEIINIIKENAAKQNRISLLSSPSKKGSEEYNHSTTLINNDTEGGNNVITLSPSKENDDKYNHSTTLINNDTEGENDVITLSPSKENDDKYNHSTTLINNDTEGENDVITLSPSKENDDKYNHSTTLINNDTEGENDVITLSSSKENDGKCNPNTTFINNDTEGENDVITLSSSKENDGKCNPNTTFINNDTEGENDAITKDSFLQIKEIFSKKSSNSLSIKKSEIDKMKDTTLNKKLENDQSKDKLSKETRHTIIIDILNSEKSEFKDDETVNNSIIDIDKNETIIDKPKINNKLDDIKVFLADLEKKINKKNIDENEIINQSIIVDRLHSKDGTFIDFNINDKSDKTKEDHNLNDIVKSNSIVGSEKSKIENKQEEKSEMIKIVMPNEKNANENKIENKLIEKYDENNTIKDEISKEENVISLKKNKPSNIGITSKTHSTNDTEKNLLEIGERKKISSTQIVIEIPKENGKYIESTSRNSDNDVIIEETKGNKGHLPTLNKSSRNNLIEMDKNNKGLLAHVTIEIPKKDIKILEISNNDNNTKVIRTDINQESLLKKRKKNKRKINEEISKINHTIPNTNDNETKVNDDNVSKLKDDINKEKEDKDRDDNNQPTGKKFEDRELVQGYLDENNQYHETEELKARYLELERELKESEILDDTSDISVNLPDENESLGSLSVSDSDEHFLNIYSLTKNDDLDSEFTSLFQKIEKNAHQTINSINKEKKQTEERNTRSKTVARKEFEDKEDNAEEIEEQTISCSSYEIIDIDDADDQGFSIIDKNQKLQKKKEGEETDFERFLKVYSRDKGLALRLNMKEQEEKKKEEETPDKKGKKSVNDPKVTNKGKNSKNTDDTIPKETRKRGRPPLINNESNKKLKSSSKIKIKDKANEEDNKNEYNNTIAEIPTNKNSDALIISMNNKNSKGKNKEDNKKIKENSNKNGSDTIILGNTHNDNNENPTSKSKNSKTKNEKPNTESNEIIDIKESPIDDDDNRRITRSCTRNRNKVVITIKENESDDATQTNAKETYSLRTRPSIKKEKFDLTINTNLTIRKKRKFEEIEKGKEKVPQQKSTIHHSKSNSDIISNSPSSSSSSTSSNKEQHHRIRRRINMPKDTGPSSTTKTKEIVITEDKRIALFMERRSKAIQKFKDSINKTTKLSKASNLENDENWITYLKYSCRADIKSDKIKKKPPYRKVGWYWQRI